MSDFEFWQQRYATVDYIFGTRPSAFLESCKPILPRSGRALALADGEGRNGVWLAQQGLEVLSLEFSPLAQDKARKLATSVGVSLQFELGDVHDWTYPPGHFDVVADIFTQFSTAQQRPQKFASIRKTLKEGGLLILQGYTPKQLQFGTGGPRNPEQLYTPEMMAEAFAGFCDLTIRNFEEDLKEGTVHYGPSAFLGLTGYKPD